MKTNLKYTLPLLALATAAFVGCSDDVESWVKNGEPDPSKELIDFTGTNGGITRAGLQTRADGQGELKSFGGETKIVMRMKSEDKRTSPETTRYTRTTATASPVNTCGVAFHGSGTGNANLGEHDHVEYSGTDSYRYWDDAFGRYGQVSVYAVAVPGKSDISDDLLSGSTGSGATSVNTHWFTETTDNNSFIWTLENNNQTESTILSQDICYSRNIRKRTPSNENPDDAEKGVFRFFNNNGTWAFKQMVAGRMEWTPQSATAGETVGKFDQGNLIFHHALSKVTIQITEGTGFNNSSNEDFAFTTKNVELLNFPYTGTFDIASGNWTSKTEGTFAQLRETTALTEGKPTNAKTTREVVGLTLPDKVLKNNTANALHFVIDHNDYYVTCDQIATAIQTYYAEKTKDADGNETNNPNHNATLAGFTTMKQGEHYVIKITISKTRIEKITAQLVDWETVTSSLIDPSNAYVTVNLEERKESGEYEKYYTTDSDKNKFDIYRKESLKSSLSADYDNYITEYDSFADYIWDFGYTETANKATGKSWSSNSWNTGWTWPNNLTYYHLRVVGNDGATAENQTPVVKAGTDATGGDYFEINGGALSGSIYKDAIWGAPFTDVKTNGVNSETVSDKFEYSATAGFDKKTLDTDSKVTWSQIYKAIGATKSNINMMLFHMTSQFNLTVRTTTGTDAVELITGEGNTDASRTKVEILRFYQNGTVLMGNGKVDVTGTTTDKQQITYGTHTPATDSKGAYTTFNYGVIPQILNRYTSGDDSNDFKVGLCITTPNGNQYFIQDISTVYADVVSETNLKNPYQSGTDSNSGKYLINRWYPGYRYNYTVTISKTKIENITAQLVDWETVTGDLGEINLEGTN